MPGDRAQLGAETRFKPGQGGRLGAETRFKPGQGGRPKGARNRFSGAFLAALEADFREHGAAAIARVRTKRPWDYLRLMVLVLPRRTEPEGSPFDGLSDEVLEAICALRRG